MIRKLGKLGAVGQWSSGLSHPEPAARGLQPPCRREAGGVAIGDQFWTSGAALAAGLFAGEAARPAEAASGSALNAFLALGAGPRRALRLRLSELLAKGSPDRDKVETCPHAAEACTLHLPAHIGDYTDFYVGIHHATNVGKQFRPDNPLLSNYKHVPIGYHGRASSINVTGTPVRRPKGQTKPPDAESSGFGRAVGSTMSWSSGVWFGSGNAQGSRSASVRPAAIGGFCLLDDWSARDIQAWSISRSDRSSPRTLRARFPRGSSRRRRLRPSASPSRSAPRAILRRCPT